MNINIQDVITLDGQNKYFVAGKHLLNNITYLYIININNYEDIKIVCLMEDNGVTKLIDVEDSELLQILSIEFLKQSRNMIADIAKNNKKE